jgi:hypothetical protein
MDREKRPEEERSVIKALVRREPRRGREDAVQPQPLRTARRNEKAILNHEALLGHPDLYDVGNLDLLLPLKTKDSVLFL